MKDYILIDKNDNVAVALNNISKGTIVSVNDNDIALYEDIMAGHKFCIKNIGNGDMVIKYGLPIGLATKDISAGEWVHTHNLRTGLGDNVEYNYMPDLSDISTQFECEHKDCFKGYMRNDGRAGVRNEIWIIPTVGCVNSVAKALEKLMIRITDRMEGVDDVVAFTHPYGCSQMGEDQENTRKILANLAKHPNAGGVLLVGLGCENSGIDVIKEYLGDYDEDRIRFMVCQDVDNEIDEGINLINELINNASRYKKEDIPVSKLVIGLKCGGSDGLSGITANPLVGRFSDVLVGAGGTTILTEVPEMFGAETLLMNRCKDTEVFEKTVTMINDFKDYYRNHNQPIYENPSPGNKKGGISTLEDKALGCTQKSGTSQVKDVVCYAGNVTEAGLNLLSSPGNDLVAATALAAAGAQIVLFTTGRGTPFSSPVPTVKISTNSNLANKKSSWIDFDAGVILNDSDFDKHAMNLYHYVIEVASGKKTNAEIKGYHDMAIFKQGVTL